MEHPKQSPPPLNLKAIKPKPVSTTPQSFPSAAEIPDPDPADFLAEPIVKVKHGSVTGKIEMVVFVLLLSASFVFGLENLQSVNVKFVSYNATFPLGVAMLIAALAGGILVALVWGYWSIKKKLRKD